MGGVLGCLKEEGANVAGSEVRDMAESNPITEEVLKKMGEATNGYSDQIMEIYQAERSDVEVYLIAKIIHYVYL